MKRKFLLCFLEVLLTTVVFAEKLKLNSDANLRSQPSKNSNVITTITKGSYVEGEISQENPDWYAITENETTGFIHKSLLDSVVSASDIKDAIIPFRSGLFWWIVIDKLILIGVFLYFFFTGKIGKGVLWALVCLGSTLLIAFIFTVMAEGSILFVEVFGLTALLCIGVSPFILMLLIVLVIICWATGTKKEPKLKAVTYWIEE